MESSNIIVELTATDHCGVHRYTYNSPGPKVVLFPISHSVTPGILMVNIIH